MKYLLSNKQTDPGFKFLVKVNKADAGYFLYNDIEEAMRKARILSLTEWPITLIYEPFKDFYGEWLMQKTYLYIEGKPIFNEKIKNDDLYYILLDEIHAMFYLESGEWLNPGNIQ